MSLTEPSVRNPDRGQVPRKVEPSALGVLLSSEPLCLHLTFDVFQGTLHDAREDGRQRTRRRLLQWAARLNKITVVPSPPTGCVS